MAAVALRRLAPHRLLPRRSTSPIAPTQRQRPVQIVTSSNPTSKRTRIFEKEGGEKRQLSPLEAIEEKEKKKQRRFELLTVVSTSSLPPTPPRPPPPPATSSPSPSRSYQASRDDLAVFAALSSAPCAKSYPAAARWFSHIKALLGASFPGAGKGVSVAGAAGGAGAAAAPAAAAKAAAPAAKAAAASGSDSDSDDDDDLDLFGEMTPEEQAAAEAKKKVIEEAKRRGAEKAKLTKSMIVLDVKPWDDETDLAAMEAEVRRRFGGVSVAFFWKEREREQVGREGDKERKEEQEKN